MNWLSVCAQAETRLGPEGRLGVSFLPLGGGEGFSHRGDEGFPAASVIKVPIMVEALKRLDPAERHALQAGDVVGGAGVLMELHLGLELTVLDLIHLMIVVSDNTASNMLIGLLGMAAINEVLPALGMKNSVLGRKFMVEPDSPVNKNFTTPNDMTACLASLYRSEYLPAALSTQGIDIMARQQYREKIPLLLPETVRIAHKTGEISGVRHDVAIVFHPHGPYILTALTHQVSDVLAADRVIADLSLAIFQHHSRT